MPSRRHFLTLAGAGAASALVARRGLAAEPTVSQAPAKKIGKHAYELALASYSLRKFPLDQVWDMTNRVGLKHLCIHPIHHLPIQSTPDQIAQAVEKAKAAGLDLYASGVLAMRTPADVDQAFDFAKAARLRVLISSPMPELLPLINEKVQKFDIRVAIHNHGPNDKLYPTPEIVFEKIKDLDPRIGMCIDIGHTLRYGVDPYQAVEQFANRLMDIHIKDVNAAAVKGKEIEIGRGVIDIPKLLRTLDKIGYQGMVSFEYEPHPTDPLPGLAESVGYVRGVMAAT